MGLRIRCGSGAVKPPAWCLIYHLEMAVQIGAINEGNVVLQRGLTEDDGHHHQAGVSE